MRDSARRPDGGTEEQKPVPFSVTFTRMVRTLGRQELQRWRPRMALALFITIIAKIFAVAAPIVLGMGVDGLDNPTTSTILANIIPTKQTVITEQGADHAESIGRGLYVFILGVLAYGAARFLSNALPQVRDAFFVRVTQNMNRVVAHEAFLHAQKQSLHFHLTKRAGALNRVIERGSGAMEFLLRFVVFNIGPTFIELLLAASVVGALYGVDLALIMVGTIVLYVAFTVGITGWRNKLRRAMNEADTSLKAITVDTLANFETVKSFAAEEREAGRFNGAMKDYIGHYVRSMQSMNVMNVGQETIMTSGIVAVAIVAGYAVLRGDMEIGAVMAVILIMRNIYRPLTILGFAWREINQSSVDVEKLYELLKQVPEIEDKPNAKDISLERGEITFEEVSFSYQGRDQSLDQISFTITPGSFVGVVGPSGAGKSTLVKLLYRFYDPASGHILVDGQDISEVTQTSLRNALGLVPQDVTLFNDTLRMNVAYASPQASDDMVLAAIEKAQLSTFVSNLPSGLDTMVGERGLKLSGGERQRVGLARAILSDPCILVLDEATSSLDSTTEEEVQLALREAARGRTTIAIAHRLSTIANADRILVLEEGKIAEMGNHDALLAQNGLYAELWSKQITDTTHTPVRA